MQQAEKSLDIPSPNPDFYPRKVNVYQHLINENVSLAPIFPFTHPGSIISGTTCLRGDVQEGRFHHANTVDEVLLCLGSSLGQLRAGQMFVQSGGHDVAAIGSGSEDDYLVFYYVQRQPLSGIQRESVTMHCERCNHALFSHQLDWADQGFVNPAGRPLNPTVVASQDWAVEVNADPTLRKCPECGHQNDAFPNEKWGWSRYAMHADLAGRAENAMKQLAL